MPHCCVTLASMAVPPSPSQAMIIVRVTSKLGVHHGQPQNVCTLHSDTQRKHLDTQCTSDTFGYHLLISHVHHQFIWYMIIVSRHHIIPIHILWHYHRLIRQPFGRWDDTLLSGFQAFSLGIGHLAEAVDLLQLAAGCFYCSSSFAWMSIADEDCLWHGIHGLSSLKCV